MKPSRTFNGTAGQPSTGIGGPDTIETDLDAICTMFDPDGIHEDLSAGGIATANIQDSAVTTAKIASKAVTSAKIADELLETVGLGTLNDRLTLMEEDFDDLSDQITEEFNDYVDATNVIINDFMISTLYGVAW